MEARKATPHPRFHLLSSPPGRATAAQPAALARFTRPNNKAHKGFR
jgi:hypothetical protein